MLRLNFNRTLLRKFQWILVLAVSCFALNSAHALDLGNKAIVGNYEKVVILPGEITFQAKLDTGAKNSSMHATGIEIFTLNQQDYVRFNTENLSGKSISMELPVARFVRIKRHNLKSQRRPVVELGVCMGSVYKKVEVTLTDRSKFNKRFLVGVSFLSDSFIVDVADRYTKVTSCNSISGR